MKRRIKNISEFQVALKEGGVLTAPNGRASNLPKRLYDTVRTIEFKRWFGEWENDPENASEVVDENGEPLVVYHGTPSYGFDTFLNTYDMPRSTENELNNLGTWFTDDKLSARKFMFDSNKGGIYEVFLNIRNPKRFDPTVFDKAEKERLEELINELGHEKARLGSNVNDMTPEKRDEYNKIKNTISDIWDQWKLVRHNDSFEHFMNYRDKYAEYIDNVKGKKGHWLKRMINTNKNEANKKLVHEFKTGQHDGILIADTKYDAPKGTINQYVVFDPENIKSTVNTTFDPDKANIHEKVNQKTLEEGIYSKMSNSNKNKIMEENKNTKKTQNTEEAKVEETKVEETKKSDVEPDEPVEEPKEEDPKEEDPKEEEPEEEEPKEEEPKEEEPEEDEEETSRVEEMDTFNVTKRRLKTFSQFVSASKKIAKQDKTEHEIVKNAYSGEKKGKKAIETLDTRKEKKGEHKLVKIAYSGDVKGKKGRETLDKD